MHERKKIILQGFLLLILGSILCWQWLHREQPVPAVKDETEHRALAMLLDMLETGRVRGWRAAGEFWETAPDRRTQMACGQLMGGSFRSEFTFQGSATVEGEPEKLLLYGTFEAGIPVEILIAKHGNDFKIISMNEM